MTTRINQIVAALTWAERKPHRSVYAASESGKPFTLTIVEGRGNDNYAIALALEDGTDFDALLDAKEKERDAQTLHRLKLKLQGKDNRCPALKSP